MNKIISFMTLVLFLGVAFQAQAAITPLEPFKEIKVTGKINLLLQRDDIQGIEISGNDDKVIVEVVDGVLKIKRKELWNHKEYRKAIDVKVIYQGLQAIHADAGAEVSCTDFLAGSTWLLDFGSGATAHFEMRVKQLVVKVSEGANLKLEGKTFDLEAHAATGGILEAATMEAENLVVKANTGGQAEVSASQTIDATANTGGQIDYAGNPAKVRISDELGGKVRERGAQ